MQVNLKKEPKHITGIDFSENMIKYAKERAEELKVESKVNFQIGDVRKLEFDVTPLVMAFTLAPSLEYAFGQTLSLGDDGLLTYLFLERPIAALIICATPVITWKLWKRSKRLRDVAAEVNSNQVK